MKKHIVALLMLLVGMMGMVKGQLLAEVPDIAEYVWVDSKPVPLNQEAVMQQVVYPHKAIVQGIEGKMFVRVLVDEFGNYQAHKVTREIHPMLTGALEQHLPMLSFVPATRNEAAMSYWTNLTFVFEINEAKRKQALRKRNSPKVALPFRRKREFNEHLQEGLGFMESTNYDEAIISFTRSILADAKPTKKLRKPRILTHYNRAKAYAALKQWTKADADLTEAIGLMGTLPHSDSLQASMQAQFYLYRGIARLHLSRPVDALEDFNWLYEHLSAHLYTPGATHLQEDLGTSTYREALPMLIQLADYNPNNPVVDYLIGYFCQALGMREAAAKSYITAVDKSSRDTFTAFLYDRLGENLLYLEQYAEALSTSEEAILLTPQHPIPYYNKAIALLKLNERESAMAELEFALEMGLPAPYMTTASMILQHEGKNAVADVE